MPLGHHLTPTQKEQIVSLYHRGLSHQKVADAMGLSSIGVRMALKRLGVKGRASIYVLDHTFFDQIDRPEKAYFLGWILSDGCIFSGNNSVSVTVTESDKHVLEKLKKYIEYSGPIGTYTTSSRFANANKHSVLRFASKRCQNALGQYGCTPYKTYSLDFPTLPTHLVSHFMRGFVEGDGCFNYIRDKFVFSLLGTHSFMHGVLKVIKEQLNIQLTLTTTPYKWMSRISKGHRRHVMTILDWLYKDCGDMFLNRKHDLYLMMKQVDATKPLKRTEWTHRRDGRPRKGTPLGPRNRPAAPTIEAPVVA